MEYFRLKHKVWRNVDYCVVWTAVIWFILLWHPLFGCRGPRDRLKEHAGVLQLCSLWEAAFFGNLHRDRRLNVSHIRLTPTAVSAPAGVARSKWLLGHQEFQFVILRAAEKELAACWRPDRTENCSSPVCRTRWRTTSYSARQRTLQED